jgi:hypothetical protein
MTEHDHEHPHVIPCPHKECTADVIHGHGTDALYHPRQPSPEELQAQALQQARDYVGTLFTYHAPFGDQVKRYGILRGLGADLADAILLFTPAGSREQTLAIDNLRQAIMWANAAIACNEQQPPPTEFPDFNIADGISAEETAKIVKDFNERNGDHSPWCHADKVPHEHGPRCHSECPTCGGRNG